MLFGEYVFVSEVLNENELEYRLENVDCDFYDYGLCNGYYPTPYPTHASRPNVFDIISSRTGLREQLV